MPSTTDLAELIASMEPRRLEGEYVFVTVDAEVAPVWPRSGAGIVLVGAPGSIGAASEDILKSSIEDAKRRDCAGLVIRLDTPGGALDGGGTGIECAGGDDSGAG